MIRKEIKTIIKSKVMLVIILSMAILMFTSFINCCSADEIDPSYSIKQRNKTIEIENTYTQEMENEGMETDQIISIVIIGLAVVAISTVSIFVLHNGKKEQ